MNPIKEVLTKSKDDEPTNYVSLLHDALMKEYGWIPFEEFKSLPIPTVIGLIDEINKRIEKQQQESEKAQRWSRKH